MDEDIYTVWVNGNEVNSFYLSKADAEDLAEDWKRRGHEDVFIERCEWLLEEEE